MTHIETLIKHIKLYISNFDKVHLYKKDVISDNVESKYLEKRLYLDKISSKNIVNGRLTICIPNSIINEISEVLLISE
jgi:hypothetical protein